MVGSPTHKLCLRLLEGLARLVGHDGADVILRISGEFVPPVASSGSECKLESCMLFGTWLQHASVCQDNKIAAGRQRLQERPQQLHAVASCQHPHLLRTAALSFAVRLLQLGNAELAAAMAELVSVAPHSATLATVWSVDGSFTYS